MDIQPNRVLGQQVSESLQRAGCHLVATHSSRVADEAKRIAMNVGANEDQAEVAGWLHDISAMIPRSDRLLLARLWNIPILPEERVFPPIIHQKLSAEIAAHYFQISDQRVLDAIGCHTTLRAGASLLDKVVFVADKIAWDQEGIPPYLEDLQTALKQSVDAAAFVYLDYLMRQRSTLPVLHPWTAASHQELEGNTRTGDL